ncbi:MAG: stage III sporulation protein AC [Clostridia bacterium]|nr:stage III sporulation protein AC [Clostridia bacterium]
MDINAILKIAGVGILTAIVCIILKRSDRDDIATFATIAGLVIVIALVIDMVGGLFDSIKSILSLY